MSGLFGNPTVRVNPPPPAPNPSEVKLNTTEDEMLRRKRRGQRAGGTILTQPGEPAAPTVGKSTILGATPGA